MAEVKTVDVAQLKEWLDKGEAVLIDVRELAEVHEAYIPGTTHVPLAKITKADLPKVHKKKIVLHCKLGKRSEMACEKLLVEDPSLDLYNLEGGIVAWQQSGLGVKSTEGKKTISVERQVQIFVGVMVLLGVALGYFVHPGFLLLAGFIGAGMLYSGMKGSCALAMLLMSLPWNR